MRRHLLNKFGHPYYGTRAEDDTTTRRTTPWAVDREHLERFYVLKSDLHKFESRLEELENKCSDDLDLLANKVASLEAVCATKAELDALDLRMGVSENNYVSLKTEQEALVNASVAELRDTVAEKCNKFESDLKEMQTKVITAKVKHGQVKFGTINKEYSIVVNSEAEPLVIAATTKSGHKTFATYGSRIEVKPWHALRWNYVTETLTDFEGHEIIWDEWNVPLRKFVRRPPPPTVTATEEEDKNSEDSFEDLCPMDPQILSHMPPTSPCNKKPLVTFTFNP